MAFCPVVTNVVNPRAFSLKMVVFGLRLTTFVTEVLARRCESCWFDDVCNVGRPLVARPGLAAAHGYRSLALPPPAGIGNLSRETGVAFARSCACGVETAIAFVGEKKLFWARFSVAEAMVVSCWPASVVAEVMVVSMVAVQGRAVVLSVSKSPRCRASCAKKFALRGLMCA